MHTPGTGLVVDLDAVVVVGQRERAAIPGRSRRRPSARSPDAVAASAAAGAASGSPARSAFRDPGGLGPACRAATRRRRRARRDGRAPEPEREKIWPPETRSEMPILWNEFARYSSVTSTRGSTRPWRMSPRPDFVRWTRWSARTRRWSLAVSARTPCCIPNGPSAPYRAASAIARSALRPEPKYAVSALRDLAGVSGSHGSVVLQERCERGQAVTARSRRRLCPATRPERTPKFDSMRDTAARTVHRLTAPTGRDESLGDGVIDPSEARKRRERLRGLHVEAHLRRGRQQRGIDGGDRVVREDRPDRIGARGKGHDRRCIRRRGIAADRRLVRRLGRLGRRVVGRPGLRLDLRLRRVRRRGRRAGRRRRRDGRGLVDRRSGGRRRRARSRVRGRRRVRRGRRRRDRRACQSWSSASYRSSSCR